MLYSGFLLIRVDLRTKVANIQCANPNWLLQLTQTSSCVCLVSQSCTILLDAMDCNLPIYEIVINWQSESENHSIVSNSLQPHDYTVHGILQARILEWVVFPSPGDLPNPGIKPRSPALSVDSLPAEPQGKPKDPIPKDGPQSITSLG